MKKLLFYAVVLIAFSCNVARFDKYPGVHQTKFPESLQGSYYFRLPTGLFGKKDDARDTAFLIIKTHDYVLKDSSEREVKQLDENTVLSLVGGKYYVLSTRDEMFPAYWNCTVLLPGKTQLIAHPVLVEVKKNKLNKYFAKEFLKLDERGDSSFVYKMNDAQFERYFEKELKGKESLQLKRLKK